MKQIKKIQIIEEGRICSPEEMNQIRGGAYSDCEVYTGCNSVNNCGWFSYETCKAAAAAYGYENYDGNITCNIGYNYNSGNITCGSSKEYTS